MRVRVGVRNRVRSLPRTAVVFRVCTPYGTSHYRVRGRVRGRVRVQTQCGCFVTKFLLQVDLVESRLGSGLELRL